MITPTPLATVSDVEARTEQEFTSVERARVAVLCADASAMARSLVPSMPVPAPPTAVGVVSAAVLRALATPPEGLKDEAIGGHSRTLAAPISLKPHPGLAFSAKRKALGTPPLTTDASGRSTQSMAHRTSCTAYRCAPFLALLQSGSAIVASISLPHLGLHYNAATELGALVNSKRSRRAGHRNYPRQRSLLATTPLKKAPHTKIGAVLLSLHH